MLSSARGPLQRASSKSRPLLRSSDAGGSYRLWLTEGVANNTSSSSSSNNSNKASAGVGSIRSYHHYRLSGEMAQLKEPSPPTVFYDEPQWPKVLEMTPEAIQRRERQKLYDHIQLLPTSNHKQFVINNERGRRPVFYTGKYPDYNSLNSYQYATRTAFKGDYKPESLPEVSSDLLARIEEIITVQHTAFNSRDRLRDILVPAPIPITSTTFPGSFKGYSLEPSTEVEHVRTKAQHILVAVLNALRCASELTDSSVLEQARLEAFWQHPNYRAHAEEEEWDPITTDTFEPMFQHMRQADMLVSTTVPLTPIVPLDSPEVSSCDFPTYDYYPRAQGFEYKSRHLVSCVGYWPESGHFPLVMADDRSKVIPISKDPALSTDIMLTEKECSRRLAAHSLMTNFAAAVATAYNQGFTLYHEVTYPIVSQCIVSDSQRWHFSRLQLNTMAFGRDFSQDKQNLAWSSDEMMLYDTVEDGKVKGLNKDVIARIIATLQAPRSTVDNATPYIDLGVEHEFLERGPRMWRHMAARRFQLGEYLEKEVPMWVRIYKMHPDAPPSPMLKWERKRYQHMYQMSFKLLKQQQDEMEDIRRQRNKERLFEGKHLRDISTL